MIDDLVIESFKKAIKNRGLSKDRIFHSDRGSQYTSNDFEDLLEKLNVKHSYSKKVYPYNNAGMERYNFILRKEEVDMSSYKTFNEAQLVLFDTMLRKPIHLGSDLLSCLRQSNPKFG